MARAAPTWPTLGWTGPPSPPEFTRSRLIMTCLPGVAPPSRGCWFGSAEKRGRRDAETAGYSLRADSPPASAGIEDSIFQLDSCDTFELHKGGSCRLIYLDLIIFE